MKKRGLERLSIVCTALLLSLLTTFPSLAATASDHLEAAIQEQISAHLLNGTDRDSTEPSAGALLGTFTTSAYCSCDKCSSGHKLTYSGTVPQARHTVAADLDLYPLGTKLMIDGIVYTVEDMGNGVDGNWLDIYFQTHEEALAYGLQTVEVYAVQ